MSEKTVADLLSGGGAKPAKFDVKGTTHKGEILKVEVVAARDIDTNEPAYWPDGSPKEQIRIILQTEERDSDDPEDDGQRAIYLKGGRAAKALDGGKIAKTSLEAVKDALKVAGAKDIEVGATLALQYAADGEKTKAAYNAPKCYVAAYQKPVAPSVDPDNLI